MIIFKSFIPKVIDFLQIFYGGRIFSGFPSLQFFGGSSTFSRAFWDFLNPSPSFLCRIIKAYFRVCRVFSCLDPVFGAEACSFCWSGTIFVNFFGDFKWFSRPKAQTQFSWPKILIFPIRQPPTESVTSPVVAVWPLALGAAFWPSAVSRFAACASVRSASISRSRIRSAIAAASAQNAGEDDDIWPQDDGDSSILQWKFWPKWHFCAKIFPKLALLNRVRPRTALFTCFLVRDYIIRVMLEHGRCYVFSQNFVQYIH